MTESDVYDCRSPNVAWRRKVAEIFALKIRSAQTSDGAIDIAEQVLRHTGVAPDSQDWPTIASILQIKDNLESPETAKWFQNHAEKRRQGIENGLSALAGKFGSDVCKIDDTHALPNQNASGWRRATRANPYVYLVSDGHMVDIYRDGSVYVGSERWLFKNPIAAALYKLIDAKLP